MPGEPTPEEGAREIGWGPNLFRDTGDGWKTLTVDGWLPVHTAWEYAILERWWQDREASRRTVATLEAENARLRAMVRPAFQEGFNAGATRATGHVTIHPDGPWNESAARTALKGAPA